VNIDELKKVHPALFQHVFSLGFTAGLNHTRNVERRQIFERQVEAAELIANAGRNEALVKK
jgi:hypothetical protein